VVVHDEHDRTITVIVFTPAPSPSRSLIPGTAPAVVGHQDLQGAARSLIG
jgi:hypothetical protein